jgi:hypothetical protein
VIHTLLPDQYLPTANAGLALPQRRLMMAVLQTVIDDVQSAAAGCPPGAGPRDSRERERACAYIASHDRSWPFSFENVCEAIGVDPAVLRRGLAKMLGEAAE